MFPVEFRVFLILRFLLFKFFGQSAQKKEEILLTDIVNNVKIWYEIMKTFGYVSLVSGLVNAY